MNDKTYQLIWKLDVIHRSYDFTNLKQGRDAKMKQAVAAQIVKKAIALGYDQCGIIPFSCMDGYKEKLEERPCS